MQEPNKLSLISTNKSINKGYNLINFYGSKFPGQLSSRRKTNNITKIEWSKYFKFQLQLSKLSTPEILELALKKAP